MKIVIGLGNPGKKYQFTRHNMGFLAVDKIVSRHSSVWEKKKNNCCLTKINIDSQEVLIAKPQTYMNLSGNAVREIINYYKIGLDQLLIVYDDINYELGKVKLRKTGGAGSHNGIESIINSICTKNFPRLKIGIGPKDQNIELSDFVLMKIKNNEMPKFRKVIDICADIIEMWISDGIEPAMNKYN
jgi:PTH1 family peptidyl-tRNA hydrolase